MCVYIFVKVLKLGRISQCIHVQAADGNDVSQDPTIETAWLQGLTQKYGIPSAQVVFVDFTNENSLEGVPLKRKKRASTPELINSPHFFYL